MAYDLIAITGRSGSGKSAVSRYYTALGQTVLDADAISREVLYADEDVRRALLLHFGTGILADDEAQPAMARIAPKRLAAAAFENAQSANALTQITHPAIVKRILALAQEENKPLVFVDGAVIIGAMLERYCKRFIVITAPQEDMIKRIVSRDAITRESAMRRLSVQLSQEEMCARADFIIENFQDEAQLLQNAQAVLRTLLKEYHV